MYWIIQAICAAGFDWGGFAAGPIFDAGRACGIPYAPDVGLRANWDHPDSAIATAFHAFHSSPDPHAGIIRCASSAFAAGAPPPGPAGKPCPSALAAAEAAEWIATRIADTIADVIAFWKAPYMPVT